MNINLSLPTVAHKALNEFSVVIDPADAASPVIPLLDYISLQTPVNIQLNEQTFLKHKQKLSAFGGREEFRFVQIPCDVLFRLDEIANVHQIQALKEMLPTEVINLIGIPIRFTCTGSKLAIVTKQSAKDVDIFIPIENGVEGKDVTVTMVDDQGADMNPPVPVVVACDVNGQANAVIRVPANYVPNKASIRLDMNVVAVDEFGAGLPATAIEHTELHTITVV